MIAELPALAVAVPLTSAGLLLACGHWLPGRVPDAIASAVALAVLAACLTMAVAAGPAPLVTWFGGWTPRAGLVIGIGFLVDQTGAVLAGFAALIVAAALLFAWGFFAETHAHLHVLALLFLAAMVGFSLTHDVFNLFVWLEVMSVAAFALTGYQLVASALEGALNFTVTQSVGSYLMLGGIGLLYARAGALDYAALARAVAAAGPDPVMAAAFALIACALLIKAAVVPFQFWLADAHAVARSPVSVIFSAIMVPLGLYGLARLYWSVFAGSAEVAAAAHRLLPAIGAVTAVAGGVMALRQRHLKRLLAFSTIAHSGIMLVGLAAFDVTGQAGMALYLVGHGLVKGALFMVAGILLATRARIDEIDLRGLGRGLWPAGLAMGAGGLLLAGLPLGLMGRGGALIAQGLSEAGRDWCLVGVVAGAACTGAAVLRATGRVFLGWGAAPDPDEQDAPTEEEQERANRPFWFMMVPTALLLLLALPGTGWTTQFALRAAAGFLDPPAAALLAGAPLAGPPAGPAPAAPERPWLAWLSTGLALLIAAWQLGRHRLPGPLRRAVRAVTGPPVHLLGAVHSGVIGDYVTWVVVGLALFSLVFAAR
jgi:multicomponent Na+:H+ antiporter subunit D